MTRGVQACIVRGGPLAHASGQLWARPGPACRRRALSLIRRAHLMSGHTSSPTLVAELRHGAVVLRAAEQAHVRVGQALRHRQRLAVGAHERACGAKGAGTYQLVPDAADVPAAYCMHAFF